MALVADSVLRALDTDGDSIKVFDDGAGNLIQAAALVDENAAQTGTAANPLRASDTATQAALGLLLTELQAKTEPADTQQVSAASLPLPAGASTEATLASILAKLIAAPATEAKQDTGNGSLATLAGKDFATQTTLAAVLAKIIAAPATEAKQDTGNGSLATIAGKDFATQTTLAALLAELQAKADLTETQPVSLVSVPSHNVTNIGTFPVQAAQSGVWSVSDNYAQLGTDAGGRKRTSNLTTLGDYKTLGFDRTLMWENAGTGTGTWGSNLYTMSVTSGQWRIRQSRFFHAYFSGKSQPIEMTCDNFHTEANLVKRFGYFSSNAVSPYDSSYDGFWLENDGTTIRLKAANAGTLTLNKTIDQWSGYANLGEYQNAATWQNFTVVLFDFLWLGGAVLRLWVRTASGFVLAHVFNYPGTAQGTFILSPCQPIRYEMRSTTGSGTFRPICAQVATEGSIDESGMSRSVRTPHTGVAMASIGTTYPILALRKNSLYRDVPIQIVDQQVFVTTTADQLVWELQINPTLSAGLTYADVTGTAAQAAVGNGTITVTSPGTVIMSGSLAQNTLVTNGTLNKNYLAWLAQSLSNTMDQVVLCGTPITTSITGLAHMAFKEY